jgi:hypothetical protein
MITVKYVQGNPLRLGIKLRLVTMTLENGRTVTTSADFVPNPKYPCEVLLSSGARGYWYKAVDRCQVTAPVRDIIAQYLTSLNKKPALVSRLGRALL